MTDLETETRQLKEYAKNESGRRDGNSNVCAHCAICNHKDDGPNQYQTSPWEEIKCAILPKDLTITPTATYIEQDVICKQRKEIMQLMEELRIRDQELNDLVRSHQAQVKAWEVDRNKLTDLQQRLTDYENDLQKSDHQLQLTIGDMKQLSSQKEIDDQELLQTRKKMEKLSQKINENSFYLKELESHNKKLLGTVKDLHKTKEKLENKGKDLESQLVTKTEQVSLQAAEVAKLMQQNKSLDCRMLEMEEILHNSKTAAVAWKKKYCFAKDESDRLTREMSNKDGNIQNLTGQLHETLQQTLALQKSLYTTSEREKCKDELMNSFKKQQKRTMQELSSIRTLYERQTKDLTLYHLSIQDSRQEGVDGDTDSTPTRQTEQKDKSDTQGEGNAAQNLTSHSTAKPGFLKYESRGETFLVKKKISGSGSKSPDECEKSVDGSWKEKKSVMKDNWSGKEENSDQARLLSDSIGSEKEMMGERIDDEKENSLKRKNAIHLSDMGKEIRSKWPSPEFQRKIERSCSPHLTRECYRNMRSSNNEDLSNNQRPRSKSSSPRRSLEDRGSSPITNIMASKSRNHYDYLSDLNIRLGVNDFSNNKSLSQREVTRVNGDVEEKMKEEKKKEWKEMPHQERNEPEPRKQHHNETSGVYLSSSDCSTVSLMEEKNLGELTPADSDGMCRELKREFLLDGDESLHSYRGGSTTQNKVHFNSSPATTPENSRNFSMANKRRWSEEKSLSVKDVGNDGENQESLSGFSRKTKEVDKEQVLDVIISNRKERWGRERCLTSSPIIGMKMHSNTGYKSRFGERKYDFRNKSVDSGHSDRNKGNARSSNDLNGKNASRDVTRSLDFAKENTLSKPSDTINVQDDHRGSCDGIDSLDSCSSGIGMSSKNRPEGLLEQRKERKSYFIEESHRGQETYGGGFQRKSWISNNSLGKKGSPTENIGSPQGRKSSPYYKHIQHRHDGSLLTGRANETDSDCLPAESDQSDLGLFTPYKSRRGSHNSISIQSSKVHSFESSSNSQRQNEETGSKSEIGSRHYSTTSNGTDGKDTLVSSVNSRVTDTNMNHGGRPEYYYEECPSSDSEAKRLTKKEIPKDNRCERNAYITSMPSRPYLSAKPPSLYNVLSSIHFSEKSKRYEWISPDSVKASQNREHLTDEREKSKPSTSYASNEYESGVMHSNSSMEKSYGKSMNSNNSCDSSVSDERRVIEGEDVQDSNSCVDTLVMEQSLVVNMDKFHHHFNNIVQKLNFSNNALTDESNSETDTSHKKQITSNPLDRINATDNHVRKFESMQNENNVHNDDTLFSLSYSQSEMRKPEIENDSAVIEKDIVRKLDFSDSTCTDKSHVETAASSLPLNVLNPISSDILVDDTNEEKIDIDFACVDGHELSMNRDDCVQKHVNTVNSCVTKDVCDVSDRNETDGDKLLCSGNRAVWNIIGAETEHDIIKREHYNSSSPLGMWPHLQKQAVGVEDYTILTSLPDYFPDISSVMADDSSTNGEEGLRRPDDLIGCHEKEMKIEHGLDNTLEMSLVVTPPPHSKPYSRTSTPTGKNNAASTRDLDSPRGGRTLTLTEDKILGKQHGNLNENTSVRKDTEAESESGIESCKSGHDNGNVLQVCISESDSKQERKRSDSEEQTVYEWNLDSQISYDIKKMEDFLKGKTPFIFNGSSNLEHSDKIKQWQHHQDGVKDMSKHRDHIESDCVSSEYENEKNSMISYSDKNTLSGCAQDTTCGVVEPSQMADLSKPLESSATETLNIDLLRERLQDPEKNKLMTGLKQTFEDRLSVFLEDSSGDENPGISKSNVPMSPSSKLQLLLVESQEMIRSLEKSSGLKKASN